MEHVDYPHHPGALPDCQACEDECFCDEDYDCFYCLGLVGSHCAAKLTEHGMDCS